MNSAANTAFDKGVPPIVCMPNVTTPAALIRDWLSHHPEVSYHIACTAIVALWCDAEGHMIGVDEAFMGGADFIDAVNNAAFPSGELDNELGLLMKGLQRGEEDAEE